MRHLLVLFPISLGAFDLLFRESSASGFGWILIGIGVFFLIAQTTSLLNPPKTDHIKFDWLSHFVFLLLAVVSLTRYIENNQNIYLLQSIGFLLVGLSTIDVLLASFVKKKVTIPKEEAEEIISVRFQDAFKYLGLGFIASSIVVSYG